MAEKLYYRSSSFFFADGTHLFTEGDDDMFGKRTKEILELKAELKEANFLKQFWKEMAAARETEIRSLLEDNERLRNELSELRSKLEKGEK